MVHCKHVIPKNRMRTISSTNAKKNRCHISFFEPELFCRFVELASSSLQYGCIQRKGTDPMGKRIVLFFKLFRNIVCCELSDNFDNHVFYFHCFRSTNWGWENVSNLYSSSQVVNFCIKLPDLCK